MLKEILVIDDNPDIRLLVSNILKDQNFEVRTAAVFALPFAIVGFP